MELVAIPDPDDSSSYVKPIVLTEYTHHEGGLDLKLKSMTVYLLNEAEFDLTAAQFDPKLHEHSIPTFERARIYLLICALTHERLDFLPSESADATYQIYEAAYQRCLRLETEPELIKRLIQVAQPCGFKANLPS